MSHEQTLTRCKVNIVRKFPFASFITLTSNYVFSDHIKTMAASPTNGGTVLINPEFMMTRLKNDKQRCFVLLHEFMHLFLQHCGRQVDHHYHHQLWNVATDYCINGYLNGIDSSFIEFPSFGLHDEKFNNKGSDQIYHELLSEIDKDNGGNGSNIPNNKQIDDWLKSQGLEPFDEVSREPVSDLEKSQIKGKLAQGIAQQKLLGAGHGDIIKLLQEVLQPTKNWKQILAEYFETQINKTYASYERYNRRSGTVIFPSYQGLNIKVKIGLDTSGSIGPGDISSFFGEINGILSTVDSWEVELIECDTQASVIGAFSSENGDTFDVITEQSIRGGGGTDMNPILDIVNEADPEEYALLIVFTDGCVPPVTQHCVLPTLFVITRDGDINCNVGHHDKIQINS